MSAKRAGRVGNPKLPVIGGGVARSKAAAWRAGVLIAVHLLIALHLVHWLTNGTTLTPVEPSEAAALGRDGVINTGLVFFALMILSTAIFGRFFCGWACHLVALQDLCAHLLQKLGLRPQPLRSRVLVWVPLLAALYMFVWPLFWRLFMRDGGFGELRTEWTTPHFWATFPGWIVGGLTFLVCGFGVVWLLGAKGFCTYACPYGAFFGAVDRVAPLRIRVTDACEGCGHCTAVCTSNVRVHEEVRDYGAVVDPGCMKCLDCVSVCPKDALYLGFGAPAVTTAPRREPQSHLRRLPWSEELVLALAFVGAFFAFRGLHALVPFLLALGIAGMVAFAGLLGLRLVQRRDYSWRRSRLRRAGRLTSAGLVVASILAVVLGGTVWAGVLRWHEWRADVAFDDAGGHALYGVGPATGVVGDLARAERHLLTARRLGILEHGAIPGRLARIAWVRGDLAKAELEASRALDAGLDPERPELLLLRGRARLRLGNVADGRRDLSAALEQAPELAAGWNDLALSFANAGEPLAAKRVFEQAAVRFPRDASFSYNAGYAAALAGDLGGAESLFRETLGRDPGFRVARENLAGLLASQGRTAEAIELLEQGLALEDHPEMRAMVEELRQGTGKGEEGSGQGGSGGGEGAQ